MIEKLLYKIAGNLPMRLIKINNKPYLERHYIGKFLGISFYLHRFISDDSERHLHNHPWAHSLAIVLAGGYTEERMHYLDVKRGPVNKLISRYWRPINYISGAAFHRITNPKPETWTLFMHSKVRQNWGFIEHIGDATDLHRSVTLFHQPLNVDENRDWASKVAPASLNSERTPFGGQQK